jgi:HSP20 family protein
MKHQANAEQKESRWGLDFTGFQREMDRVLTELFKKARAIRNSDGPNPACDVREKGDLYEVVFDVPALERNSLRIEVEGNQLVVSGILRPDGESADAESGGCAADYLICERGHGQFTRTVLLPAPISSELAEAFYQDGVLTVSLPKADGAVRKEVKLRMNEPKSGSQLGSNISHGNRNAVRKETDKSSAPQANAQEKGVA